MKVFISWSGQKSRDVAQLFHDWLPLVLHMVEPFVSSKDIRAGTRWQAEVASELDDTDFGLICVSRHNQDAPG
ncbi:MAG TPA: TIR domain-containing protein [Solirubrobacterales bacterium]|nr:TIR domain-containing protein [Solirubrobacterales bacterium]